MDPEGFVRVGGLRVYYRSEGEPDKGTILGLHGGPGYPYDYLVPVFDLAKSGYRVVFFDQTGGGKSEVPKNPAAFTIERYAEEVEGVRRALGLGKVHLFGFSWGGMLAQAYALKYQSNLTSLILSGTCSSIPDLQRETEVLFQSLPSKVKKTVENHEDAGDFQSPEYADALDFFDKLHGLRKRPIPEALAYSSEHVGRTVGDVLFGPNLVQVTGNMRYWSVTEHLGTLRVPCLLVCGEHDFLSPKLHREMQKRIKGSKLVILKDAGHLTMWDTREAYLRTLTNFLDSLR